MVPWDLPLVGATCFTGTFFIGYLFSWSLRKRNHRFSIFPWSVSHPIGSRSGSSIIGRIPIRPKIEKKLQQKISDIFGLKIAIYSYVGLNKGRPSYRRSLQPAKENIQHFKIKTWNFFFSFLWVIFALPDPDREPDPLTLLNPDTILIRFRIRNTAFHAFFREWIDLPRYTVLYVISNHRVYMHS